jgi:hypothetical protein
MDKPNTEQSPVGKNVSKEGLLRQADGLRDLARRARRLAETSTSEPETRRLTRYVEELNEDAGRLEKVAVEARSVVFKT